MAHARVPGTLQAKSVPTWMLFPFAYAAYSLMHGAVMGFYPYPFLDVAALGYEQVLLNMGLLIVVFAGLGLLLVGSRAWPLASAKDGLESPRHRQKKLVNRLVRLRRERWTHHKRFAKLQPRYPATKSLYRWPIRTIEGESPRRGPRIRP
ncbi:MAG: Pr6Pr family membrane protein [Methyloceanibacter sp.]